MYVLNFIDREIVKMNNYELSDFLLDCSKSDVEIANYVFMPTKKMAKNFIEKELKEGLPQCQCWK